jgi:hypothetical protein
MVLEIFSNTIAVSSMMMTTKEFSTTLTKKIDSQSTTMKSVPMMLMNKNIKNQQSTTMTEKSNRVELQQTTTTAKDKGKERQRLRQRLYSSKHF